MDFTFFLDGAFWASRARRTSLAVGEPGSSNPTDSMVGSSVTGWSTRCGFAWLVMASVTGWSTRCDFVRGGDVMLVTAAVAGWPTRRGLARGGAVKLAFCYQKNNSLVFGRCWVQKHTESWRFRATNAGFVGDG